MCTVSIISTSHTGGYRLVTNRDEQRTRAAGEAPKWRRFGSVDALAPLDPVSGGTWVATNREGLSLCILNGNLEPPPPAPARGLSRGLIIPALIGSHSLDEAMTGLSTADLSRFAPFRLVMSQSGGTDGPGVLVADAFWNGRTLEVTTDQAPPVCFVSSGLGDSRVAPRLPLFASVVTDAPRPEAQDEFHRHVWPDRPEISVCMSRAEARTVSITTIRVDPIPGSRPSIRSEHAHVPEDSRRSTSLSALASGVRSG